MPLSTLMLRDIPVGGGPSVFDRSSGLAFSADNALPSNRNGRICFTKSACAASDNSNAAASLCAAVLDREPGSSLYSMETSSLSMLARRSGRHAGLHSRASRAAQLTRIPAELPFGAPELPDARRVEPFWRLCCRVRSLKAGCCFTFCVPRGPYPRRLRYSGCIKALISAANASFMLRNSTSHCRILTKFAWRSSPLWKGCRPVFISYKTSPSAHQSTVF
mmetsp:Transcript_17411/g.25569  ORF Transcript_17411/g.25569 Transcript_17411/m.25569 type:complete len:220 (+) Transcript_17411:2457-3116(+)